MYNVKLVKSTKLNTLKRKSVIVGFKILKIQPLMLLKTISRMEYTNLLQIYLLKRNLDLNKMLKPFDTIRQSGIILLEQTKQLVDKKPFFYSIILS